MPFGPYVPRGEADGPDAPHCLTPTMIAPLCLAEATSLLAILDFALSLPIGTCHAHVMHTSRTRPAHVLRRLMRGRSADVGRLDV